MILAALALVASGPSFDCAKATTAVEKMICADPQLTALDRAVARLYAGVPRTDRSSWQKGDRVGGLWTSQPDWLKERDRCADRDCLIANYDERLGDLFLFSRTPTRDYHSEYGRNQNSLEILDLGGGWFAFNAMGLWVMDAKIGAVNETTTYGHFKLVNGSASNPASEDGCGWEIHRLPHDRWQLNELHFEKDFAGCGGVNATVDGVYSR